jgi:hypothetical protein
MSPAAGGQADKTLSRRQRRNKEKSYEKASNRFGIGARAAAWAPRPPSARSILQRATREIAALT